MDSSYDEDLSENPFLIEFKTECEDLFYHCIAQSWVVCVPRVGALRTRVFTPQDFLAHVLVPSEELPQTHFTTLTEKSVTLLNKVLTLDVNNFGLPLESHILFEETFYTEDYNKYKVWCIESLLEPSIICEGSSITKYDFVQTVNNCIDFIWTQSAGRHVLENIEIAVRKFLKKTDFTTSSLTTLKDLVGELYTKCLQIAMQNKRLKEKARNCKQLLGNIKLSVETYMQHLIFAPLFKSICTCTAYEDSNLNKIIRNLSDMQLRDLEVKKELYDAVPKAKKILSEIRKHKTVLEKIVCLRKTLNAINKQGGSKVDDLLNADDLLPVLVFLLIKSGLPNWQAQLIYIKHFRFSSESKTDADETGFLITTLEAVIEHIRSGALVESPYPESQFYWQDESTESNNFEMTTQKKRTSCTESVSIGNDQNDEDSLAHLFEQIKLSNYDVVKEILENNHKQYINVYKDNTINYKELTPQPSIEEVLNGDNEDSEHELCHPLCDCKKCCQLLSRAMLRMTPTINSRESHGFTPLHVASMHGAANIVDLLLSLGSDVDITDFNECTPLHYAAARGHQNALLLILHAGANLNKCNADQSSPLHMAANNGHENCVKALVYFSEYCRKDLNINGINDRGNTALHLAAKWGYENIVRILIEYGAEPSIENKKHKNAFDDAHNLNILHILQTCKPNLNEYAHIENNLNVRTRNKGHHSGDYKNNLQFNCKSNRMFEMFSQDDSMNSRITEDIRKVETLLQAIAYRDVKLACFYMDINCQASVSDLEENPGSPDKHVCHPLCKCTNCPMLKLANNNITSFNFELCNSDGNTALHMASKHGLDELCNIILDNGAKINTINKSAQTPLHLAVLSNRLSTVQLLLKRGVSINATDIVGNTALHNACFQGYTKLVEILLSKGGLTQIKNSDGNTPVDLAKDRVFLTIIDMLGKHNIKKRN